MTKQTFLLWIKVLILLSPLPFGCVGRVWSPLFHLLILLPSVLVLARLRPGLDVPALPWIRRLALLFFGFTAFQLLPLPRVLLNLLSPHTVRLVEQNLDRAVTFHPLSLVPGETLAFGLNLFVMVFLFYVLVHLDLDKGDIYGLIHVLTLSALFQALFGLAKWALGNERFFLFFHRIEDPEPMLSGTLALPEHSAFYLELVLPLILGVMLVRLLVRTPWVPANGSPLRRLWHLRGLWRTAAAALIVAAAVYLTRSLSAKVVLLLAFFLMAVGTVYIRHGREERRGNLLQWMALALVVIALFMAWQSAVARVHRPDRSGNLRAEFWQNTTDVFARFPVFGSGMGTFKHVSATVRPEAAGRLSHSHNEYLEMLADGGVVGAGLLFALAWLLFYALFSLWRRRFHPEVKIIGLAALVSVLMALFHSLFDFALRIPANAFLLTLILALGFKMVLYKKERRDAP